MKVNLDANRRAINFSEGSGSFVLGGKWGSTINFKQKTSTHTLSTGGLTSTLTGFFEDGMVVMSLTARITSAVTTGGDRTTLAFGDGAVTWATKAALTAGSTFRQVDGSTQAAPKIYAAATDLVLTVSGGSSGNITGGVVEIVCFYYDTTAPTV